MKLGQRISIIGTAGAGKSKLAAFLGKKLNIPVTHLDKLYWTAGWIRKDKQLFMEEFTQVLQKDCWIMEGGYQSTMKMRMEQSDTVIFLNFNRFFSVYRVLKRLIQQRGRVRDSAAEGCHERIELAFLKYILWDFPTKEVPVIAGYEKKYPHLNWIVLNSPKEVKLFMNEVEKREEKNHGTNAHTTS